jgi:hypothetical protein
LYATKLWRIRERERERGTRERKEREYSNDRMKTTPSLEERSVMDIGIADERYFHCEYIMQSKM